MSFSDLNRNCMCNVEFFCFKLDAVQKHWVCSIYFNYYPHIRFLCDNIYEFSINMDKMNVISIEAKVYVISDYLGL